MKPVLFLIFFFSFVSCAHASQVNRVPAFAPTSESGLCIEAFTMALKYKANPSNVAEDLITYRQYYELPVILDIGGEERYVGAINLNPQPITCTTGEAGRIIPNWVPGSGNNIPLPKKVVDAIHLENAPININVMWEMQRVMGPRGKIHLSHPQDYADTYYHNLKHVLKKLILKEWIMELLANLILLCHNTMPRYQ